MHGDHRTLPDVHQPQRLLILLHDRVPSNVSLRDELIGEAELNVRSDVLEDPDLPLEDLHECRENDEVLIGGRKTLVESLSVDHVTSLGHLEVFAVLLDHGSGKGIPEQNDSCAKLTCRI